MLPDELFLFTTWLAIHNTQLNDLQRGNQERIEKKIDEVLKKVSEIEKKLR